MINQNIIVNNASIEAHTIEEMENEKNSLELIKAIQDNDIVKVATILQEGDTPVNYIYKNQVTALSAAALEGNIEIMELLGRHRVAINQSFEDARDAGWVALENHQYEAFDWLIKKGLPVNRRIQSNYETRLMAAVKNSDLRMVNRLLQLNVNVEDSDIEGRTALHYNLAISPYEIDDAKIGELLLAGGCDPNRKDQYDLSAHAYIKDDKAYTVLSNHELEMVDKNAIKRMEERELAKKAKEQEKAAPKNVEKKKKTYSKGKKYRPK